MQKKGSGVTSAKAKTLKKFLIGIIAIQVMVIITTVLTTSGGGAGSKDNSSTSVLPIWLAVFFPIFAARKKGKKAPSEGVYWVMIGIALLLLFASVLFLVYSVLR